MIRFNSLIGELRILHAPRVYLRVWRAAVMYWPREPWRRRFEFRWDRQPQAAEGT